MTNSEFLQLLWNEYDAISRDDLPWRHLTPKKDEIDPYSVLVSEIMLQQTQATRVIDKFNEFMAVFPTMNELSAVSFQEVLSVWTGLGYTRRAKYLHEIAKALKGRAFPDDIESLVALKGIGNNTAAAILVYSFNQKHVFIETNVRTVLLYHFFQQQDNVSDAQLEEKLSTIVDELEAGQYREFYWAVMDYGTKLKKMGVRNNAQSKHYKKQSKFEGSRRQIRGKVMKQIAATGSLDVDELHAQIDDKRLGSVLDELHKEGLVVLSSHTVSLQ